MNTELTERAASPKTFSVKVALDLSPHSEATAEYALGVAKTLGACVSPRLRTHTNKRVHNRGSFRVLDHEQQAVQEKLTNLAKALGKSYPACTERFIIGEPASEVVLAARELDADLIITASHHPSFLGRLFGLDQAAQDHARPMPGLGLPRATTLKW